MAYSYIEKSGSWTPTGATTRTLKGRLYYQITETETTYKIDVYGQSYLSNENTQCKITGTISLTGKSSSTGSHQFYYSSGANPTETWRTYGSTLSNTWTKTHVTQTPTASYTTKNDNTDTSRDAHSTASKTFSIPAKKSYVVSYNVNGGTGTIANQTKWYGESLTLSNGSGFTRTGYTLSKWNTKADGTGTNYDKSAAYTSNAVLTLYAIWTANTYTVAYNKNNSSATGTTASSSHTYDVAKALTANGYTLTNYLFEGWSTSATGALAYTNSQSVKNLGTSGTVTLYAKWKYIYDAPDIRTVEAVRWNVTESAADDAGDAGRIKVYVVPGYKYTSLTAKSMVSTQVKVQYRLSGSTGAYTTLGSVQTITKASTLTWTSGARVFDITKQYEILVTASVVESGSTKISSTNSTFISIAEFILDFDNTGKSIGFFHVADGATAAGDKAIRLEGDIVIYLDNNAGTGLDHDILQSISSLGWSVNAN